MDSYFVGIIASDMGLIYKLPVILFTFNICALTCATFSNCDGACEACTVKLTAADVIVTCTGSNITKVPEDLPGNTTKL